LFVIDAIGQRQPHALLAHEILRVGTEGLVPGYGEIARQVAEPARGLGCIGVLRMGHADDAVARLKARRRNTDGDHLAHRVAAQLLRQREWSAAGNLVARQVAGPVLHVPSRNRTGEVLDQYVALAERRQVVFAIAKLVGPAIFEQADGHGLGRDCHSDRMPRI
jgi:hypothetical protein